MRRQRPPRPGSSVDFQQTGMEFYVALQQTYSKLPCDWRGKEVTLWGIVVTWSGRSCELPPWPRQPGARQRCEFIPIKSLAATGSGGLGSYAGHSRFPSRHHGHPASTGGFDDAATLDTAVDMLDPQSAGVEHLVGSLLETVKGMGELRWASYNQPYVSAAGD
jgi:hypothetical protein